jgi:hypothetical protein
MRVLAAARGGRLASPSGRYAERVYLHEAIEAVLRERDGLTCRALATTIDRLDLFRQSDGEPPPSNEVSARVSHHREMFERRDGKVFLHPNVKD